MSFRLSIPFLLSAVLFAVIFIGAPSLPLCTDPLGCIWLGPGAPLEIGVARISSGNGQIVSQEVQQGAEVAIDALASSAGRPIVIRPSYSACIPEMVAQSTIDLAANSQLLAVLGPTCPEETANFWQRMSRTGKTAISPIPFQRPPHPDWPAFAPDLLLLASQAAEQMARLTYIYPIVSASPDDASQTWAGEFCAQLSKKQIICLNGSTGESIPDVQVWVSLAPTPSFLAIPSGDSLNLPVIVVSPSVPDVAQTPLSPIQYWIGPAAWNESAFIRQYQQRFQTAPVSLAAQLAYESMFVIAESARQTAVVLWDGTWIIPRQAFSQQVAQNSPSKGLFRFSCDHSSPDCPVLPLSLYQWAGNEYRLANP
jgi:hypothetical protein